MDNEDEQEDQEELTPPGEPADDGELESPGEPVDDGELESPDEPVDDGELESPDEPEQASRFASWVVSRTRLIALLVGVVFLAGVVYAAINSFTGRGTGAKSAEIAVEELVTALSNEDIVAALNVMAPSEVGTLGDVYPRFVELLVEDGTIEKEDWLEGVDFEVVGLETRAHEVYPGVALVQIRSGTLSVNIDHAVADPIFAEVWEPQSSLTIEELRERLRELDEMSEVDDLYEAINAAFGPFAGQPLRFSA